MVLHLNWLVIISVVIATAGPAAEAQVLAEGSITFERKNIELTYIKNKKTIRVELAKTPEQHARGLMFREKLKNNEGMLFMFKDEQARAFWMKNTLLNLDIGYFDKNKKLIDIQQMRAVTSIMQTDLPSYPSKQPAMYALEMPQGWFKKNKFPEMTIFKFVDGL